VYRVIRAPERRVFYIDVGNISPEDIPTFMKQAQDSLKRNKVVDKNTGRVDLRYNPLSVDEDYFLPVRGTESGTRIDTLAGGQNTAAIEDVEYIQKKLFAALKIPRAYLGYDEEIGSKATLAQEDIRFSRAIQRIQKTVLSELNKLAIIHLYAHGFSDEDLLDFELKLSNPSSIAQQQKLELIRTKFEIAAAAPEGIADREWVRRNVMGFNTSEIEAIEKGREEDKKRDVELEAVTAEPEPGAAPADEPAGYEGGGDEGGAEDLFASDNPEGKLLTSQRPESDEDDELSLSIDDIDAPIKAQERIKNAFGEPLTIKRKSKTSATTAEMPDMSKMVAVGKRARTQDTMSRPFDRDSIKGFSKIKLGEDVDPFSDLIDRQTRQHATMTKELRSTLASMNTNLDIDTSSLLKESGNDDE